MQFAACFSTKDPNKLNPKEVYAPYKHAEPIGRWFHDLRDAFVAHNFGPQRIHEAGAVLEWNEDQTQFRVNYIRGFYSRYGGPDKKDAPRICAYMAAAIQFVDERIEAAEKSLVERLLKMPDHELLGLPDLEIPVPTVHDIRTTREKFRKKPGVQWMPVHEALGVQIAAPVKDPPQDSDQARPGPAEESPPSERASE